MTAPERGYQEQDKGLQEVSSQGMEVKRASNVLGMAPEEYAERLYRYGVTKGWIR